ncbi:MAG: peptidase [Eubacterium sp.]|nr:peptidase [Eubacterium sp.]
MKKEVRTLYDLKNATDNKKLTKTVTRWLSNRLVIVGMIIFVLFLFLVYRLFMLQIVEGEEHLSNFNYKIEKTIETDGARGNIYDCNGKLLAYNQLAYTVTMQNTDRTGEIAAERSKKGREVSENTVRNEIIHNLINLLESNGDVIYYDLPLTINSNGEIAFTESGSSLTRFKKDVYGIVNLDNLKGDKKKEAEKWLNSTPEQVYEYLRTGADGPAGTGNMFGIDDSYSREDTIKIMSIRYDIYMNRYSQTRPITVASNISEESIAQISEHSDDFPGVTIEADSLRRYNDAEYLSGIIGYTGLISEKELNEYNEKKDIYEASDIVGKTGIEKSMENVLRGKKGKQDVLVDKLGKVIKVVSTTEAAAGNDIYLTIDLDLQKYAYNILERRLAGILLSHLTANEEAGSEKMIPIKDLYYALIDNNVLDITRLNAQDAGTSEKAAYDTYRKKQKSVLSKLRYELMRGKTPIKDADEEWNEYYYYVYNMLLDHQILSKALMDQEDSVYLRWKEGKISLKQFLGHAISSEWINIGELDIESDYYSADEIYNELINYSVDALKTDESFDKILFKYMIKNGDLKGKRICLLLYDQGVLDSSKDKDYKALSDNELSAYNFIYKKISDLEITPAQLALDPCSGSVIITDPKTGAVRAMVSYPSYDNNKLANTINAAYFASLNKDKSSPMLNRCTQTRTAPGSTFKPISATAILEENIADGNDYVKCTGIFDKISPPAKCWIYPNAHGSLNVSGAIAVSCNFFFYEMGYKLGTVNGNYNSEKGLERLAKYAAIYGLDRKSGVELTEYEPRISDEDAVRSIIGQGTHSYTPSQISRYVTSLVNEDHLLGLSLVSKTTDVYGKELSGYEKKEEDDLDVPDSAFALIKKGMVDVVNGKDSSIKYLYNKQGMKVAGKTGTAQENKNRPNHALFISYAPYDVPDITMTVVIPNGYTSSNAAEVARDIYRYYFGKAGKEELENTQALIPTGPDSSAD